MWHNRAGRQAEANVLDFRFCAFLSEDFANPGMIFLRGIERQLAKGPNANLACVFGIDTSIALMPRGPIVINIGLPSLVLA